MSLVRNDRRDPHLPSCFWRDSARTWYQDVRGSMTFRSSLTSFVAGGWMSASLAVLLASRLREHTNLAMIIMTEGGVLWGVTPPDMIMTCTWKWPSHWLSLAITFRPTQLTFIGNYFWTLLLNNIRIDSISIFQLQLTNLNSTNIRRLISFNWQLEELFKKINSIPESYRQRPFPIVVLISLSFLGGRPPQTPPSHHYTHHRPTIVIYFFTKTIDTCQEMFTYNYYE